MRICLVAPGESRGPCGRWIGSRYVGALAGWKNTTEALLLSHDAGSSFHPWRNRRVHMRLSSIGAARSSDRAARSVPVGEEAGGTRRSRRKPGNAPPGWR